MNIGQMVTASQNFVLIEILGGQGWSVILFGLGIRDGTLQGLHIRFFHLNCNKTAERFDCKKAIEACGGKSVNSFDFDKWLL